MGKPERRIDASAEASAEQKRLNAAEAQHLGEAVYEGACSSCHGGERPLPFGGISMELSTAVHASTPRNLINVVLHGLPATQSEAQPIMPGFVGAINDEQLAALLEYLRLRFSTQPAWRRLDEEIRSARQASEGERS
jgi:mono/diheme cytochrome c family protein